MDQEENEKTEDPTARKLEESYKKGQAPISRDLVHWFVLAACALSTLYMLPSSALKITKSVTNFLAVPHLFVLTPQSLSIILKQLLLNISQSLLLPIGLILITVISISFWQTHKAISSENLAPKWERISLPKGLKRLFSKQSVLEFLKALGKFIILSLAIYLIFKDKELEFAGLIGSSCHIIMQVFLKLLMDLFLVVLVIYLFIAGFDLWFQRYNFLNQLKMSKRDLKDEMKDTEGDPHVKQRFKQIRYEKMRKSINKIMPQATVVVTNPTHFSVVLKWDEKLMDAPIVLLKGQDYKALQIRELAKFYNKPLIENPPLARSLYNTVEENQPITPAHYQAVAEIIQLVMRMRKWQF